MKHIRTMIAATATALALAGAAVDAMQDGEGATGGSAGIEASRTGSTQVQFAPGTSGAAYDGSLAPGGTRRYVLEASEDQFLDVQVTSTEPLISYRIFNPDDSVLLALIGPDTPYRSQVLQSGKHVVEIINRGDAKAAYHVTFGLE